MAASCPRLLATHRWLSSIVVGRRLCPFAPPVTSAPRLRMRSVEAVCGDTIVDAIKKEAAILQNGIAQQVRNGRHPDGSSSVLPETTLCVLTNEAAPTWMDLVRLSWNIQADAIVEQGYAEELQIVLFHPLA
eukprot:451103-Prymnesium_polylepis.1